MILYFIRHGQTDWNLCRRIQGQVDIPLNDHGKELAVLTAKGLSDVPFDRCFSSPLSRALSTAQLILAGRAVPILTDDRLLEMSFGELEGGCCSETGWNVPDDFHLFFTDPDRFQAPKGGEDFRMLCARLTDFLNGITTNQAYENEQILISTHGAALAGLIHIIKGGPLSDFWGVGVHRNCAVTKVTVTDGQPQIVWENRIFYEDDGQAW